MPRRRSRRYTRRETGNAALAIVALLLLGFLILWSTGRLRRFNIPGLPNLGLPNTGGTPVLSVPPITVPTIDLNLPTLEAVAGTLMPKIPGGTPVPSGSTVSDAQAAACVPASTKVENGTVTKVTDGDTIHVKIGSKDYTVRYIGINAPEDTSKVEYFGPEATERNRQLVENQPVRLVKDVSETDRYGRLLRYVFVGQSFINYDLVAQGYASAATFPPDVACADTFAAAEKTAREAGRGLWASATPTTK